MPLAPLRHAVANVILDFLCQLLEIRAGGAAAAGAGDYHGREGAQAHGLQDFLGNDDFLRAVAAGFGRQGHANGITDAFLQQDTHRSGGGHDALAAHAGFGQSEMQGIGAARRQIAVDGNQVLHAADLGADHDHVGLQSQALCPLGAVQCRHHDGFAHHLDGRQRRRPLRVLVHHAREQVLIEAPPIHADAHRLRVPTGRLDHFRELWVALAAAADIARIDAQLRQRLRASRMRLEQFVAIEVKIAHQRRADG